MKDDRSFPYEYGSDLHWLWGWGYCLKSLLRDETYEPGRLDRMIFRPDRLARDAMTRFSVHFHLVIKSVDDSLDFAERTYQAFCENPTDDAIADNYVSSLDVLEHRIKVAAETIADVETSEAPDPPASPDSVTAEELRPPWYNLDGQCVRVPGQRWLLLQHLDARKGRSSDIATIGRVLWREENWDDSKVRTTMSRLSQDIEKAGWEVVSEGGEVSLRQIS